MTKDAEYLLPITAPLLRWFEENKRQMPWRDDPSPYHVWISEIMLQQTRVEAVRGYYERFIRALPDIPALAGAEEDRLLKLWEGLGYYSRARNLQKAAKQVLEKFGGELPASPAELLSLPGIGAYTAGAIASLAYGIAAPAVDGNVLRVLTRCLADDCDITKQKEKRRLTEVVQNIIPPECPGAFNQALMELGAIVCLPNGKPACAECPLRFLCRAYEAGAPLAYPVKPEKKPRQIQEKTIWILEYHGEFCLEKRQEKGVLHGMWQFPNDDAPCPVEHKIRQWDLKVLECTPLPKTKHIFTHMEWHMQAFLLRLGEKPTLRNGVWASEEKIRQEYSLPAAFRHYDDLIFDKGTKEPTPH